MPGRKWLRRTGITLAALTVVGFVVFQFYEPGWRYEVRGVDVSRHQGDIDWNALAADRTAFAYIKSSEGEHLVDTRFVDNWQAAEQAGVIRGAYHFFTLCRTGVDQAANMISTVPDEPGMLPPAVDLEFGGNCSARPSVEEFRAELDAFLAAIEAEYRMRPVIYTNYEFYNAYLAQDPPDVTWWMRSIAWQPRDLPEWTFWQYFPGRRDGVDGRVDRNAFDGDPAALVRLAERNNE